MQKAILSGLISIELISNYFAVGCQQISFVIVSYFSALREYLNNPLKKMKKIFEL